MQKVISQRISLIGIAILLSLIVSTTSIAQIDEEYSYSPGLWMRIAGGMTGGIDYFGMGGLLGVQHSSRAGLIGIRYLGSGRATVDPLTIGESRFQESNEISITYGIDKHYSIIYLSASTGLGFMWGNEQMPGGNNNFNLAVIPIEFQGLVKLGRIVGVGGMLSTSINSKKTLTSAMVVIHIGSIN